MGKLIMPSAYRKICEAFDDKWEKVEEFKESLEYFKVKDGVTIEIPIPELPKFIPFYEKRPPPKYLSLTLYGRLWI